MATEHEFWIDHLKENKHGSFICSKTYNMHLQNRYSHLFSFMYACMYFQSQLWSCVKYSALLKGSYQSQLIQLKTKQERKIFNEKVALVFMKCLPLKHVKNYCKHWEWNRSSNILNNWFSHINPSFLFAPYLNCVWIT